MSEYRFHFFKGRPSISEVEVIECAHDAAAAALARRLLSERIHCDGIDVWCDWRSVYREER